MPGLFGVLETAPVLSEFHRQELVSLVQRMSKAMRYDPSYSETLLSFPRLGAYVGRVGLFGDDHVRPASAATDVVVLTSEEGEHSRQDRVVSEAHTPPGEREIERLYRQLGDEGLANATRTCSTFIADQPHDRCLVLNDRYGRERIFVHTRGTRVFFASEAKAILAVSADTRSFDATGLAEMLACGCTLGKRSLFHGIEVLDNGTVLIFDGRTVSRRRYFDPACLEQLEPLSSDAFVEGFSQALRVAVNAFVRRTPEVGISMTGGLDSRMIAASLDVTEGGITSYTFGSMYRTTSDVTVGKKVAASCGLPHHVLELGRPFLTGVHKNLEESVYISDGYLGLSGAAELYVNRQARKLATARITGNWGGELMRGVRAFKCTVPKGDFINPVLATAMTQSAERFSDIPANPISAALFNQMPLQSYGRYAIERSQLLMSTPFLDHQVIQFIYRAPVEFRRSEICAAAIIGRKPALLGIPTDLGLLGTRPSFIRRGARKALIKAEYLTNHGAPDWLARLSALLPQRLIETRFLGVDKFQHFRFWMRHELADFVRETLLFSSKDSLKAWFDISKIAGMVDDHIRGRANHTDAIDKLLTIAVIQNTLFKPHSQVGAAEPGRETQ